MKFLKYLTIISVITLTSCSNFLDTKPTDSLSPDFYYKTEDELNNALTGVYDVLGQASVYGDAMFNQLGAASDESYYARNNQSTGPMVLNYDASDINVRDLWRSLYQGIQRANLLLANIDKPEMDETKRNAVKGEVLFLRGYYHFLLVSNWGDVPLITEVTSSVNDTDIPRTPAKDVYTQIISDMETAEGLVKNISDIGFSGRVSKTAVQGILARVNLYMAGYPVQDVSKYADALSWAKKVVSGVDGAHSLNPDYKQIFINYAQDKYDINESIWEVEFWGNRIGNAYQESGRVGNTNGILCGDMNEGYSYGFIGATPKLFNLYEATDSRRDWAIAPYKYVAQTSEKLNWKPEEIFQRNMGKFRREYELIEKQKNFTPQNFPILRYADVLLMLAEAENEVNGPSDLAHDMINQVRTRANATPFTASNNNRFTNKEDFRAEIQDERARELCFEALRIPDLRRWGIYVSEMKEVAAEITSDAPAGFKYSAIAGNNMGERHILFPIPLYEMSLNKALVQNKGW